MLLEKNKRIINNKKISVIILHFNSEQDINICLSKIYNQSYENLSIIIVDNNSKESSLYELKRILNSYVNPITGCFDEVFEWIKNNYSEAIKNKMIYLIENKENRGFSVGNNIGVYIADLLNSDAVLIVNPDVIIENNDYVFLLAKNLFADDDNVIVASRILDTECYDQNPQREPTFCEELFWIRWFFKKIIRNRSYVLAVKGNEPISVPKVSGCCFMIKMDFLKSSGYLDENVFMYCEEPILSSKVRAYKKKIIFIPDLVAIHTHKKNEYKKEKKMLEFIRSRTYYLRKYSNYNKLKVTLLVFSYQILKIYYLIREKINDVFNRKSNN